MDLKTLYYIWVWGGHIAAAICCTWAFWKGSTTEKIGAGIVGVGWTATALASPGAPDTWSVIIDIAGMIAFMALAIWSRRIWVFFATAVMINTVIAHFIHDLTTYSLYVYSSSVTFWSGWALLVCLAVGIAGYRRKLSSTLGTRQSGANS